MRGLPFGGLAALGRAFVSLIPIAGAHLYSLPQPKPLMRGVRVGIVAAPGRPFVSVTPISGAFLRDSTCGC